MHIDTINRKAPLTMGKAKKALETSLDYNERQILKKIKQEKLAELEKEIGSKYNDEFNKSIMISE
jgi:hypothetical protein